ncbi:MAG: pyruvate, phosphate dikinase [Deltaproteobacteria bacterium]|nr:pyruvate, phosphate dikinase [Deltaproteobacteria bacterium]
MADSLKLQSGGSLVTELQERAKELNCLYRVEELLSLPSRSLKEVFVGTVEAIPPGWQYPEICQARVTYMNEVYASAGFVETPWIQSAELVVQDAVVGQISVYYTEKMPAADSGPFLKGEAKLIKTIAERLSHFILHQKLKQMFESQEIWDENAIHPSIRQWRVALDLLHRTDHNLLRRVSRKMMNHLCWIGISDAKSLLKLYGEDLGAESLVGESNEPSRRTHFDSPLALSDETFRIATKHLSDSEILARIQEWIHEDKTSFLVKALINVNASMNDIADALRRYQHMKPHGVELSHAASSSARVSLIRRFFNDQLDFINVAKKYVDIDDFYGLLERIVSPLGSRGQLGGKSAGLFLASKILRKAGSKDNAIGEVKTPKTWYIASDGIVDFLHYNNLEEVHDQRYKEIDEIRQDYPHIVQLFKNSHFPQDLAKGISMALDNLGQVPLIVRSSSLLEDRLGSAFSGKYKSLFLANQGSKKQRLAALKDAIAEVYASTFSPDPIEYRAQRGLLDFNEEMGILIQEVVGKQVGKHFMPAFAGVAFSNNELRWSPRIKKEDGLVRMVPGLGTRAVDRLTDDYPFLCVPSQPGLRVNVTVDEIIRYSPRKMDAINLETNRFETLEIAELLSEYGDDYPAVDRIVSMYREGDIKRPMGLVTKFDADSIVVTFEGLVTSSPFLKQVESILKTLEECLGTPVDIEFASDGNDFYLLQCRPQTSTKDDIAAHIPKKVASEDIVFTANRYVSNGRVPDITHVVYVDPGKYNALSDLIELRAVGQAVGRLNRLLPKRQFVLIGPGRWGSRGDIKLGVRVTYSDINNTAMLIEVARKKGNYVPDLSFGTHFFQDLVEASIRYLPLYPDDNDIRFNERFLLDSPNLLPDILPEYEFLADTVRVIDIPQAAGGRVLRVLMNADKDEALGMLTDASIAIETEEETAAAKLKQHEDHWRWRLGMAERIANELDPERFGVEALYVFGSVKNATAGPGSDIDLLVHFRGSKEQIRDLEVWFKGWSLCLDELNYWRTGYRSDGLLDVHIITDDDIRKRSSFAVKIGAITDAARNLPLKGSNNPSGG